MGHVFGDFLPTEYYYKNIQKSVWEFWEATKTDYEKWFSLRLNVQLENGLFLFPEGGYTIDDMEELPNESKRIDVAGIDSAIIDVFSIVQPVQPFVEEPWCTLTIEQKISFEDELKKEIGFHKKSFFNLCRERSHPILSDMEFSAFCYNQRTDDVLFAIKKSGFEKRFAAVHLTWTSKQERGNYPNTTFYTDFDDFRCLKMQADKADWES